MDVNQFLLEDLKLKVDFLNAHLQRMWTRFNFFITIESILIGLLFSSGTNSLPDRSLPFACIEAFISLVWWVFGAQDRLLVSHYRAQVKDAASRIAATDEKLAYYSYRYVSATPKDIQKDPKTIEQKKRWNPIEWRLELLSITRLAALFPLLIFLFWLLLILFHFF